MNFGQHNLTTLPPICLQCDCLIKLGMEAVTVAKLGSILLKMAENIYTTVLGHILANQCKYKQAMGGILAQYRYKELDAPGSSRKHEYLPLAEYAKPLNGSSIDCLSITRFGLIDSMLLFCSSEKLCEKRQERIMFSCSLHKKVKKKISDNCIASLQNYGPFSSKPLLHQFSRFYYFLIFLFYLFIHLLFFHPRTVSSKKLLARRTSERQQLDSNQGSRNH